jgi:Flp pilus assembly protein TadB
VSKDMSRRAKDRPARDLEPDYGVAKERIPDDWIHTRETMQRRGYMVFHVRQWYFSVLVLVALVTFAYALIARSTTFAVIAGVLTVTLYYWNQRAGGGSPRRPRP